MPEKLTIINGPSGKEFLCRSGIITGNKIATEFTVDFQQKITVLLTYTGRAHGPKDTDEDQYGFIGFGADDLQSPRRKPMTYFVGEYNARVRKGTCEMMNTDEFFSSTIGCLLFPDAAKYHFRQKDYGRPLLKVAVQCSSTVHTSMFVDIISANKKTMLISTLDDADLTITDDPRGIKVWSNMALYGITPNTHAEWEKITYLPSEPAEKLKELIDFLCIK